MEYLILVLILVNVLTMQAAFLAAVAYLIYRIRKKPTEPKPAQKTPEELDEERKAMEQQRQLEQGLANMLEYDGTAIRKERGF